MIYDPVTPVDEQDVLLEPLDDDEDPPESPDNDPVEEQE